MFRAVFADRLALALMALGLCANVSLFAYLAMRYPGLPARIPLHFNALGQIDVIGTSPKIFKLPAIGAIAWIVNIVIGLLLFQRERLASYVLWCASFLVQAMFWTAVANIVKL